MLSMEMIRGKNKNQPVDGSSTECRGLVTLVIRKDDK
jgi:hypothetical protein